MSEADVISSPPASRTLGRGGLVLTAAILVAFGFLATFAAPYLSLDQQRFGPYWPRRVWLLLHIAGGSVALLAGPVQLWLGLNGSRMSLHRRLGILYLAGIAVGVLAAFGLVVTTTFGWVFGTGLAGLAVAWMVTTGLAFIAIRRRLVHQHKEWMIRSYVVTFAFVIFRIFYGTLEAAGVGTITERLAAASWFCWAVPLLVTETVLQGRIIFRTHPRSRRRADNLSRTHLRAVDL